MNAGFDGRKILVADSEFLGEEDLFRVTHTLGASTRDALNAAHRWLEREASPPGGLPEFRGEA
jgi:hypothetical protein